MASRPVPPPGKLPKDYDKLPVPQPQATSVRKRDPKMLAIIDPGKCFGRGCEYCVAVCPVPDCITLHPDPAAETLLAHAGLIDDDSQRVDGATEDAIRQLSGDNRGVLRITTECYTCYHWLPAVLKQYRRTHPLVDIRIDVTATSDPIEALLEGRLDLAVVSDRVLDRRVVTRTLFNDELVVVMAPGLTSGFISAPLYCSIATMELNAWPVASTPIVFSTSSSPESWNTRAIVNTFEIDWIETSVFTSPIVCTWPSTVTSAMPNRLGLTFASAGM